MIKQLFLFFVYHTYSLIKNVVTSSIFSTLIHITLFSKTVLLVLRAMYVYGVAIDIPENEISKQFIT